ncbi:hypothetical protein ACFFRR_000479 [Megaselia abdita]
MLKNFVAVFVFYLISSSSGSNPQDDEINRIVGGSKVTTPIPYQVSLQFSRDGRFSHFCGGSIISEEHVLTAAHCLNGQNKDKITVQAGIMNLKEKSGTRHKVENFVIHTNYEELVRNDIAVMKVSPPFKMDGKSVNSISYKLSEKLGGAQPVMLTGWGSISMSIFGPFPEDLQYIKLQTLTNEECNQRGFNVTETEICAFKRPLNGACAGDSGGPLVTDDQSTVVGVVSYGTAICGLGYPDVYTRVSVLSDWIDEQVKSL